MRNQFHIDPDKMKQLMGNLTKKINEPVLMEGDHITSIKLAATTDEQINLAEIANNYNVVIFVYPGDREGLRYPELMGCTPEACSFRDNMKQFQEFKTKVFGLSMQSTARQKQFVENENLNFPILSDTKKEFISAFGIPVWNSKQNEEFPNRTTILIKYGGKIIKIFHDVKVEGHINEVLFALQN